MRHIAKIQLEFLKKIARKWDDLSLDEQKAYLKRHPKSKRKVTAKPLSNNQSNEQIQNLPVHGQMFGSIDGGKPEDFTNEQLSAALDKINEARKNGNLDEVKKELPKGIIAELSYSRWQYVSPEHRAGAIVNKSQKRAQKAEKLMQTGDVVGISTKEGTKFYKVDNRGVLWSSKNSSIGFTVDENQTLPDKIKQITSEGPQLDNIRITQNTYFKTTKEIPAFVKTDKSKPTGEYYGNTQFYKPVYEKQTLPEGTPVQILAGGNFVVLDGQRKFVRFTDPSGDPGVFEKNYGYDASIKQLPMAALATTDENGRIISKPKKKNLPAIGKPPLYNSDIKPVQIGQYVKTPNDDVTKVTNIAFGNAEKVGMTGINSYEDDEGRTERDVWWASLENGEVWPITEDFEFYTLGTKVHQQLQEKADQLKKQKDEAAAKIKKQKEEEDKKKGVWPEDKIVDSFQSLAKTLGQSGSMHDDEADVSKDKDGKIRNVSIGVRDLGNWESRPGEEDDDYPEWSDNSYKKYKKLLEDWLKGQSWYDPKTMEPDLQTGEKAWTYFGVSRKNK